MDMKPSASCASIAHMLATSIQPLKAVLGWLEHYARFGFGDGPTTYVGGHSADRKEPRSGSERS